MAVIASLFPRSMEPMSVEPTRAGVVRQLSLHQLTVM